MTSDRALEELIGDASEGRGDAWDALVTHFAPFVWAIARGHGLDSSTSIDVTQTCWLRLAEHLHEMTASSISIWLATTARQECLRALRWVTHVDLTTLSGDSDGGVVWHALSALPARCRLTLRLLALDPVPSDAELAAALDVNPDGVHAAVAQSLDRLARRLSPTPTPDRVTT